MSSHAVQSHLRFPLTRLLGSNGNIRVLRALLAFGAPLSTVQLARDTALTRQGVLLVVENLVGQGLVTVFGQPRSQLFSVVQAHPFAAALKAIFEQERNRWDALQQTLRDTLQRHPGVRSAWLYGSVARGEDAPRSDIDIAMVIDEPDSGVAVRESLHGLEDRFRVHFSVVALTPAEVASASSGERWWAELIRDAKLLKGASPQQEALDCSHAEQPA